MAANLSELRSRGFRALVDALGWADAVRFLRQFEPGVGNYTEERDSILPDWDAGTLARKAVEVGSRKPCRTDDSCADR
ncbi:MAG TPA: hypothetical protein ENO14_05320 [Chromatiales bacterium]|nr:hypothetical protein [Chromatiales bacterium]